MKILVVEDEPKLATFIKTGLEEQACEVEVACDGSRGQQLAMGHAYDVIMLDVSLPGINGFARTRTLRQEGNKMPILMLAALGSVHGKLTDFEAGADNYLVYSFEFRELMARLRASHKRGGENGAVGAMLRVANLQPYLGTKSASRGDRRIDLTAKEFSLLVYLLRNHNRLVSRMKIAEKVWDTHFDTGTNSIDVYVNFLRKKIDKDFDGKLIHTVIGRGYILKDE